MEWQDFKKLSTQEKYYRVEQLTDLDLNCDLRERKTRIVNIVYASNEDDYLIAIEMLKEFEDSYK